MDLEVHLRPSAMRNMTFAVRLFEDGTWRRRLDGVNHAHAVNRTTHKERVARRRREWKLNRTRTRDAQRKHTHAESATCYGRRYPDLAYAFCKLGHMKCGQPPDVRDCRPDDVAARLHTECAGWNEKDPLKRFTDEHRVPVLNEVIDRGVHICTKKGSDEIIRAAARRRRLLGLVH